MQIKLKVNNESGLHARPAAKIIDACKKFHSDIIFNHNGKRANTKSIISILKLGATKGSEIIITVNGFDEIEAIHALQSLFFSNFGE